MEYERTCKIERAEDGAPAGQISGVLTTDGEASDGHILNMSGVKLPERAPLLFGHDDFTGTGNLGSWTGFHKFGTGKKLGDQGIRGTAEIELDGTGPQQQWREDIAMMVDKGHIDAFSVRWDEIGDPVARVNLPSDHPAFVDFKKATGRQRWGLFFDKWRLLEGSVVTLGADPAALVGRMQAAQGEVRGYWRKVINHALEERHEPANGLVAISTGAGMIYVEREAYDSMLEDANARYMLALDTLEAALQAREEAADEVLLADEKLQFALDAAQIRSEVEPGNGDEPTDAATREPNPAPAPKAAAKPKRLIDTAALLDLLGKQLDESQKQMHADVEQMLNVARGRVSH